MHFRTFKQIAAFLLIFSGWQSHAQLDNFTLIVAKTDETCTGNATLTLSATGTTAGATILYSIYLLPNTSNPLIVTPGPNVTGLASGTYHIVALQSLGNDSGTQQADITIADVRVPLAFSLTAITQTCGGGTITVDVTQGQAVSYEIISGPVTVAPQASNVFSGLPAGEYNIRVTDACGDAVVQTYTLIYTPYLNVSALQFACQLVSCSESSASYSISPVAPHDIVYPLTINVVITPPQGDPIVQNEVLTSGNPGFYNNKFVMPYMLGTYNYTITATDACGHVFTSSGSQTLSGMNVNVVVDQGTPISPSSIQTTLCEYSGAYTINFTSAPPGFDPSLFNEQYPGPFTNPQVAFTSNGANQLPTGQYNFTLTDACGNSVPGTCIIGNCVTDIIYLLNCDGTITVLIPFFGAPVVSTFITASSVDLGHALPYDVSFNIIEGNFAMTLPFGVYTFEGLNVCNLPYHFVVDPDLVITLEASGNDYENCSTSLGSITGSLTHGAQIATVFVTAAPPEYNHPLPYDVSSGIFDYTRFQIGNLPAGEYTIIVTDICGNPYTATLTVNHNFVPRQPLVQFVTGCEPGFGSVSVTSLDGNYAHVTITQAPASFPFSLPYDATANIANIGVFYMNTLPEGNYVIHTENICGMEADVQFTLPGYHILLNNVTVQGNCGSFNLLVQFNPGPSTSTQYFWLQRKNPLTGGWGHPLTGAPYTEGAVPNATDSYALSNMAVNYNIAAMGEFRVIRVNQIYHNGNASYDNCIATIKEFFFSGQLKIYAAYTSLCPNGTSEVFIVAGDASPLTYRITSKDGQPFFVDNGTSNIFSGLAPGVYNFQVEDACGNIVNRLFDIISLPEPSIGASGLCSGSNGQLSVPAVSYLSYQWWNGNDPATILSTTNQLLFSPFSNATSPGTYFVRIYSETGLSCINKTLSYVVPAAIIPNAGQDATIAICGSTGAVNLFTLLGGTFDSTGTWDEITTSGMLNANVWLPVGVPYGEYRFHYRVNGFCDDFDESFVTITFTAPVAAPVITMAPQFCSGQPIQFSTADIPGATWQWTGPGEFSSGIRNPVIESPTITNSGIYTVTVSLNGCEASSQISIAIDLSPTFSIVRSCENGAAQLLAVTDEGVSDDLTYSWTGPGNFSALTNPVIITGLQSGNYSATVTSPEGCIETRTIAVGTSQCGFPAGISPNHDGKNDSFDLTGYDVTKIEIFSRYGRMVYEANEYLDQWHGQDYKDRLLPDATYYYYIRMRTGEEKTGWVYVLRY